MPRSALDLIGRSGDVIAGILARHAAEHQAQHAPTPIVELQVLPPAGSSLPSREHAPDTVIDTIDAIVTGIKNGTDIRATYPDIARLIANQEDRNELLNNLVQTNDLMRLPQYMRARKNLEGLLLDCAMRGDLSPHEALAMMSLIVPEAERITSRVRAGASTVQDVEALMNKIDYSAQLEDEESRKKFMSKTTPQARELMRRLVYKFSKAENETKPAA